MEHEVSKAAVECRRGISRALFCANAASAWVCSFQRQPGPRLAQLRGRRLRASAPFISSLLGLIIALHTCALPMPLVFLFVDAKAKPATEGCEKKTCCTPLCYMDEHGVHHCVHMSDDSCKRDLSNNDMNIDPAWFLALGTPPGSKQELPALMPGGWIARLPLHVATHEPATPVPPPK
jgi:hypothetical protein